MSDSAKTIDNRNKVLLIDDEEGIRVLLEKRFLAMGWQVEVAGTGRHAMMKLDSGKNYNLIICDFQMPGMTGVEFLRSLRERGVATPFLMITGHPDPNWLKRAGQLGLTGVLLKPFTHNDLVEKINSVMPKEMQIKAS